jgi:hypothetical protein
VAALLGRAAHAQVASAALAPLLAVVDPPDGLTLCTLLAGGARSIISTGPVEAALRHEASFGGDWKGHGDTLAHALSTVWADACRAAHAVGCADPRDLTRDNLRALSYDGAALSGLRLAGFDERLPWWVH